MDFEAQEMMTRQSAACYHAHIVSERVKNESTPIIADITTGGGGDTLAIAKALPGAKVHAFEVDQNRAQALQEKVRVSQSAPCQKDGVKDDAKDNAYAKVQVHQQSGLKLWETLERCDFIYADPARRQKGKRTLNPEEYSPRLSEVLQLKPETSTNSAKNATNSPKGSDTCDLMVKLAPGVPREYAQVWVAHKREVVEALYCSWERSSLRKAVVIDDDGSVRYELTANGALSVAHPGVESSKASTSNKGDVRTIESGIVSGIIIVEPNGSIIRAGLVESFAKQLGARFLDPRIAYLALEADALMPVKNPAESSAQSQVEISPETPVEEPAGSFAKRLLERSCSSAYSVQAVLPVTPKRIRAHLLEEGYTNVTVKKRGVDIDPHAFRKELKIAKLRASAAKRSGGGKKANKTGGKKAGENDGEQSSTPKETTLILLRTGEGSASKRYALVCRRIELS